MSRILESRRWLSEAAWDLDTARILDERARYNSAAFHCQQAAGKAAKSLLYAIGETPLGHSVRELLERFSESAKKSTDELMPLARELDRHYVPSRYPNALPSGTPHETYDAEASRRALQCAEKILTYAKKFIVAME